MPFRQQTILFLLIVSQFIFFNDAFTTTKSLAVTQKISNQRLFESNTDESEEFSEAATSASLESKMKSWEASEEEIKAATLGGVVPGRTDAFDVGLYIAFPLMVLSGLAFAFFPLIMGNIDASSVGPPPTS